MDAASQPLLLLVQANVSPEHEAAFNAWYQQHVPTLLEIPGYAWGRRYVNVAGEHKYLAAYQIEGTPRLASLLGPRPEDRHALANREFAKFERLEGVTEARINVYRQLSGTHLGHPLLDADYPISVVMMDCADPSKEADFNAWYSDSHVPNLVRIPGYVSGARFQLVEHPALEWLRMGPKYLALYELAGLECIPSLADPAHMRPEAAAEFQAYRSYAAPLSANMSWNIYRPLAKHWRLEPASAAG